MGKRAYVVLGTLFGDEGKGMQINELCKNLVLPLVVRFNGGHQAGHTVVLENGTRHVFSNFGSGTFQNAPTFWSKYCTVSPVGIKREGNVLRKLGYEPKLYLDANAMITTPFDILQNRRLEEDNNHGSVGVGFGTTIQRNEDNYHLYVRDLLFPKIRNEKLKLIYSNYYKFNFDPKQPHQNQTTRRLYDEFLQACDELVDKYSIVDGLYGLYDHTLVFEGAQGIMLDKDYGFFPHVTRSSTTSKNALEILKELPFEYTTYTYYMTRAYQNRHGNGYMTNIGLNTDYIKENPNETNVMGYQGEFRKTVLDLDMLKYAISCDGYHNTHTRRSMVITCLDQVPEDIPVTINDKLSTKKYFEIGRFCEIENVFGNYADTGKQHRRA